MQPASEVPELAVHWWGRTDDDAPTLVLMHGLTDSGRCWPDAVRRWAGSYRLAGVDALGHGRSPRFTAAQLAGEPMQAMYDAAAAALARISRDGANRVVLVGHSMGGGISAALAAWRPDLVRGAVLEDPTWVSTSDPALRLEQGKERAELSQWFRDDPRSAMADGRAQNPRWPEIELEPWAEAKVDSDDAFLETGQAWLRLPWQDIAAAITVPTLLVTGSETDLVDAATVREVRRVNPAIEVAVVQGVGHCIRREDAAAYHDVVDPWLAARFPG